MTAFLSQLRLVCHSSLLTFDLTFALQTDVSPYLSDNVDFKSLCTWDQVLEQRKQLASFPTDKITVNSLSVLDKKEAELMESLLPGSLELIGQVGAHQHDPCIYDLFGVIVHAGGAYGGHYYAYLRDILGESSHWPPGELNSAVPHEGQRWIRANDSSVDLVSAASLASLYGGEQHQQRDLAYLLVYRRRDRDEGQLKC